MYLVAHVGVSMQWGRGNIFIQVGPLLVVLDGKQARCPGVELHCLPGWGRTRSGEVHFVGGQNTALTTTDRFDRELTN